MLEQGKEERQKHGVFIHITLALPSSPHSSPTSSGIKYKRKTNYVTLLEQMLKWGKEERQKHGIFICVVLALPSPPDSSPTSSRVKYNVIDTIVTFLIQNSKVSK
jgi:hypothetical protein